MQRLLILGSGTYAVETLDIAEAAGSFEPAGFVNSLEPPQPSDTLAGHPIYWVDEIPYQPHECVLVAGIVSTKRRGFVNLMERRGYAFTTVIHPSAVISRRARIAVGCVVNAGVVVSQNTEIGPHVILNRGCLIGHDNRVEPFCTIGPGANLAGGLVVGTGVYVGVGAVIRDHVAIGPGAIIGAGAVVVKSVDARTMVAGVPARVIKTNVEGL